MRNLSKKPINFVLLLISLLLIITFAVHNYKENITQLLSVFIIEKIVEEQKETLIKGREKMGYKHLSIYYSDSDKELLPATKDSLERAIELTTSLFGSRYSKPYDLIIFKSKYEIESFSDLESVSGLNSPSLNMIGILPENKEGIIEAIPPLVWNYKSNIMHEYTHYVLLTENS